MDSQRKRLTEALNGNEVQKPAFLVYDWFVMNRDIDWQSLFDKGLGQLNHASLVDVEYPHLQIETKETVTNGQKRQDVYWKTDAGTLNEYFLDGWKQQYLIKTPNDYKIMARALADAKVTPKDTAFDKSEKELGEKGFTVGQFGEFGQQHFLRTPFQVIQIDYAGLEKFSMDIAYQLPELLELIELMNEQLLDVFRITANTKAAYIKLWENLSIETMGPKLYKQHLSGLYHKILEILAPAGKKLVVHYDGKLKIISDKIQTIAIDGFDSITPPPEGDLTIKEARQLWPDRFLWVHPTLCWYDMGVETLIENVLDIASQADHKRFCLQLSEEVPDNWQETLPALLDALA